MERCFRRGVLVDITHAREDAQKQICEIWEGFRHRPLISSHNSVRAINPAGLNLSDPRDQEDTGQQGHHRRHLLQALAHEAGGGDARRGLQLITDVIDHIRDVTESYDHIGIGSDLDGFIDPVEECSNYSEMSVLASHLLSRYGAETGGKILSGNALRVLHEGWDGVREG